MVSPSPRYVVIKAQDTDGLWPSRRQLPPGTQLELIRQFEAFDYQGCIHPIRCEVAVLRIVGAPEDTFEVTMAMGYVDEPSHWRNGSLVELEPNA